MQSSIMSTFGSLPNGGKRLTWIASGTNSNRLVPLVASVGLCLLALGLANVEANPLANSGKYGEAAAVATGGSAFSQAVSSGKQAYSQASSAGGKYAGALASGGDAMSQAVSQAGGKYSSAMASSGQRQPSQAAAFVAPQAPAPRKEPSPSPNPLTYQPPEQKRQDSVQRQVKAIRRTLNHMESEPPKTMDECTVWGRLSRDLNELTGKFEWREFSSMWDQQCRELQRRLSDPLHQFREKLLAGPSQIAYVGNLLAKYLDLKEQVPRDEQLARAYVDMVHNEPKVQEGVQSLENLLDFVKDAVQPHQTEAHNEPTNELDALDEAIRRLVDQEGHLSEDQMSHLFELAKRLDLALTSADQVDANSGRYKYLTGTLDGASAVLMRRLGQAQAQPEHQAAGAAVANDDEHYDNHPHHHRYPHHHHQDEVAEPNYYFEPKETNSAYAYAADSDDQPGPFGPGFGFSMPPFPVQREPNVERVSPRRDYNTEAKGASNNNGNAGQRAREAAQKASALGATAAATLARAAGGEPRRGQEQPAAKQQQPLHQPPQVSDMIERLRQRNFHPQQHK